MSSYLLDHDVQDNNPVHRYVSNEELSPGYLNLYADSTFEYNYHQNTSCWTNHYKDGKWKMSNKKLILTYMEYNLLDSTATTLQLEKTVSYSILNSKIKLIEKTASDTQGWMLEMTIDNNITEKK